MNVASAVSFVWDTKPDFPSLKSEYQSKKEEKRVALPRERPRWIPPLKVGTKKTISRRKKS